MKKKIILPAVLVGILYILIISGFAFYDYRSSQGTIGKTFKNELASDNLFLYTKSHWPSGSPNDPIWIPENVNFSNDQLMLTINENEAGLTSGEYTSKSSYGFGLYEVSMKPISHSGVVSAFFNYSHDDESNTGTEIDIEFLGYDTTMVQFNYHTDGVGGHEYLYDLGFDASKEFHTYGFYWDANEIIWYVDGEAVHEAYNNIPTADTKIVMDVWAGKPDWLGHYDGTTPLTAYYDWISFTSIKDLNL